jgi:hypothetical protein
MTVSIVFSSHAVEFKERIIDVEKDAVFDAADAKRVRT